MPARCCFTQAQIAPPPATTARPRFVRCHVIEKAPPRHGEKPFAQLVSNAFDGNALRLSRRLELLEKADQRHIRRGDALDLIAAIQRQRQRTCGQPPPSPAKLFARRYLAFAATYVIVALAWCLLVSAQT